MNILMTLANPFTHDPRVYNEAKSLINAGHKVTVLAWDKTKQHPKNEQKDGINIVRVYNTKFMDFLPYDFLSMIWWWRNGFRQGVKLHKEKKFDVVHCHDLSSLPIGIRLKKKIKIPLIYDAHEIWGYMVGLNFPSVFVNFFLKWEKKLCKHVDHIITVNDLLKEYFEKLAEASVTVILNAKQRIYDSYKPPDNDKFTIVYQGTLDSSRNLLKLVNIVSVNKDIRCVVGGYGHNKNYVNKIIEFCEGNDNCVFLGEVPMEEVIPNTRRADLVYLVVSSKAPKIKWPVDIDLPPRFGLANKFFEALVAGRPILASDNTYNGVMVKKLGCGVVTECNKKDIQNKILYLKKSRDKCEKMGKAAFEAGRNKYNWEEQEKKLVKLYQKKL